VVQYLKEMALEEGDREVDALSRLVTWLGEDPQEVA
jgi:hypothetical protein